ncbi:MAG: ABC transporter ATP-binding protein [Thermomicrobiales bacterium]
MSATITEAPERLHTVETILARPTPFPATSTGLDGRHDADVLVETHGLTKRYGTRASVENLDLTVRRGEVYGFLGPNGAGKTTTLRMLLGLIVPTSGTATVVGRAPGDPAGLARVGALVESPAFYPYLSGRDNLEVLARYAQTPQGRVEEVLEVVDLADRADDGFKTYSLGMKQRLGVAAALLKNPELLIFDEPTNGLDPKGMADMRDLVRRLGSGRTSVLLSSHLLGEVEQICDRVGVIRDGRLVAEGTVEELRGAAGLTIRADPIDLAARVVERLYGADRVRLTGTDIRLQADPAHAPAVARGLVAASVDLIELHARQQTLEEIFLHLTDAA